MYTTDLNSKVYMFMQHNVSFDTEFNKYIFCNEWANAIDKNYFDKKIADVKQLLHNQLKYGKKNNVVLKDLLEITGKKMEWFRDNKIYELSFIDNLKLRDVPIYTNPSDQKITSKFLMNYTDEKSEEFEEQFLSLNSDIDYFYKLTRHANELNNYNNPLDFEKVQLMYCFELYKVAVSEIHYYIYKWEMDLATTDLSKIEFDALKPAINVKCNSSWNKIDLARLFQCLSETAVFYFDKNNSSRNSVMMKKFIETNFTYYNTKSGQQHEIENINKEFSEVNAALNKDKQIEFLENLIQIIKNNKDQFKSKRIR